MKRDKIVLVSLFAILMIVGLTRPTSALGATGLVISPHGVDVPLGSEFTIDVLINLEGTPGDYTLEGFDFYVQWDQNYVQYEDRAGTYRSWTIVHDAQEGPNKYHFALQANGMSSWGGGLVWLSLMFRCVGPGSSEITAYNDAIDAAQIRNENNEMLENSAFNDDTITVNQHSSTTIQTATQVQMTTEIITVTQSSTKGAATFTVGDANLIIVCLIAVIVILIAFIALRRRSEAPYIHPPQPTAGRPTAITTGFCINCGAPLKPGVKFCGSCGERIE